MRQSGITFHGGPRDLDEIAQRKDQQPPYVNGITFHSAVGCGLRFRGRMGRERILFRQGGTCLIRNGVAVPKTDPYYMKHFTDANGDFAVELIRRFAEQERPFFLNVWWLVPHMPYEPAPEPHWSATAAEGISDDQHRFRSMVRHMDAKIGRIVAVLRELGLLDDTLLIFTSDNGASRWPSQVVDETGRLLLIGAA